jgi:hypothetical protein
VAVGDCIGAAFGVGLSISCAIGGVTGSRVALRRLKASDLWHGLFSSKGIGRDTPVVTVGIADHVDAGKRTTWYRQPVNVVVVLDWYHVCDEGVLVHLPHPPLFAFA